MAHSTAELTRGTGSSDLLGANEDKPAEVSEANTQVQPGCRAFAPYATAYGRRFVLPRVLYAPSIPLHRRKSVLTPGSAGYEPPRQAGCPFADLPEQGTRCTFAAFARPSAGADAARSPAPPSFALRPLRSAVASVCLQMEWRVVLTIDTARPPHRDACSLPTLGEDDAARCFAAHGEPQEP